MAPHSSTLAWKIPWTEEPGGLQSMESPRVRHDWATSLSRFTFMRWRRKWQATPVFLPGESRGRGAWWAAVYGVAQSRTRLKRLSSSSSSLSYGWVVSRCIHTTSCAVGSPMLRTLGCSRQSRWPPDCSPPGSSIHGIFQARILEWGAVSYSRESSWPRGQTYVSCVSHWQADSFRRFTWEAP